MMQSGYDVARLVTGARIPFPALSEEERKSFLGTSISHVVSLFHDAVHHESTRGKKERRQ